MPKRPRQPSMADIIADLKASPGTPRIPRLPPGIHDGRLVGRDGVRHDLVRDGLTPEEAMSRVAAGADVVFDECGCGGTCGLEWVPAGEAASLARRRPVLRSGKGHAGSLSLWGSESGQQVVLAQGPVDWAP